LWDFDVGCQWTSGIEDIEVAEPTSMARVQRSIVPSNPLWDFDVGCQWTSGIEDIDVAEPTSMARYSAGMEGPELHRKRMRRWETPGQTRFVTFSCQHRLPLFRNQRIAQLFVDRLAEARREHQLRVFAWVVMPEHVHLLCRPPQGIALGS